MERVWKVNDNTWSFSCDKSKISQNKTILEFNLFSIIYCVHLSSFKAYYQIFLLPSACNCQSGQSLYLLLRSLPVWRNWSALPQVLRKSSTLMRPLLSSG